MSNKKTFCFKNHDCVLFFELKKRLNNLKPINTNKTTNIKAIIGKKIANTDKKEAAAVSVVETIGFPKPAVFTLEAARVAAVVVDIAAAVPPPAIIAKPQVSIGSKFNIVDAIATVPAIPAKGNEIVSNKLSTNGI